VAIESSTNGILKWSALMTKKIKSTALYVNTLILCVALSSCGDDDSSSNASNSVAIMVGGQVAKVDTSAARSIKKVQRLIRRGGASKSRGLLDAAQSFSSVWEFAGGPEVPGVGVADDLTAVALDNRQVLVTGGFEPGSNESTSAAYLFDGNAETWEILPNMNVARRSHTMTRLQDDQHIEIAAAELFDPASQSFTPVQPPNEAYGFHMAVRLNNGQVLIAGGGLNNGLKAELFDPSTEQFIPVADMLADARVAALLPDGTVLVAGGISADGDFLATAEFYDPLSDSFVRLSSTMDGGRNNFAGAVLQP
jgi:hypothetical protein